MADSLGYRRLTLHRPALSRGRGRRRWPRHIARGCRQRRGSSSSAMTIRGARRALHRCRKGWRPGDHPATDLPGADRLYPRGDQSAAGWPHGGGWSLGRMTPRPGEVLMVSGRQRLQRAHRLRIPGFREVLSQRFPHLQLSDVLARRGAAGADHPPGGASLCRSRNIVGIYNTGLGNTQIAGRWPATAAKATSAGSPPGVTTPPGSGWRRAAALTLDQNAAARPAGDRPDAAPSGSGYQPQTYADGKVDFILYSAENVD